MFSVATFLGFVFLFTHVLNFTSAASCWRKTNCTGPSQASFSGPWDTNNFSPASRNVGPLKILDSNGDFLANYPSKAELTGNGSLLIFDFGKEVGGIVSLTYGAVGNGTLGLAFTESKNWTGQYSDDSNGALDPNSKIDGALFQDVSTTLEANYTMPDAKMRGGFRYLTLFSSGDVLIQLHDINCEISFAPTWSNLRAYGGYFDSSDALLNQIWYAGAYTLQTNAIPPSSGRRFPVGTGWSNDQELNLGTTGETIYVDGSKRDRTIWAGDLAIAIPSVMVSTGDWDGVRNTLQVLLNDQADTGALPFAGPGLNIYNSDTYHMISLIGIYEYYLFTMDDAFMTANWNRYVKALTFITNKIDKTGLLYVTGTDDWGRIGQGAHNSEANMLMYKTLTTAGLIAGWQGDSSLASNLVTSAAALKAAVNSRCWDASTGAFGDSEGDNSIHPQDGNSMALLFGAANNDSISSISEYLTSNWVSIGSVAPELPNNLIGFGQSFEVKGHFEAQQATRALNLTRRAWGWYLNNPEGTASTCIEGYLSDGSFGYRSTTGYGGDYSYTSHAHGWSTGPTDALTSYVAGLRLTSPGGSTWTFAPQFGDLTHAEAGFTTPLGKFRVSWTLIDGGYTASWGSPSDTKLTLVLPSLANKAPSVKVDASDRVGSIGEWSATELTYTIEDLAASGSVEVRY